MTKVGNELSMEVPRYGMRLHFQNRSDEIRGVPEDFLAQSGLILETLSTPKIAQEKPLPPRVEEGAGGGGGGGYRVKSTYERFVIIVYCVTPIQMYNIFFYKSDYLFKSSPAFSLMSGYFRPRAGHD